MRGRGLVAAIVAGLVLLVVPLGLVPYVLAPLPAGESTGRERAERPVAGDPAVAATMTCGDDAAPAAASPTDVVGARLCATDNGLVQWYAPQDGLHADLGPLVDLLGGLEQVPESTDEERYFCTDDGGVGFDLRLALASGEVVSVPGDTGGCSTVRIGDEDLVGSDEVVATFLEALVEQRGSTAPPAELVDLPLDCDRPPPEDHRLSLIGDPADLIRAVTCWRPNADETPPWRDRRPVPPQQLTRLVADVGAHTRLQDQFSEPNCPGGRSGYYWQDLVGQTRWGDVVAVRGVCREFLVSQAGYWRPAYGDPEQRYWQPARAAQRILDGLRR